MSDLSIPGLQSGDASREAPANPASRPVVRTRRVVSNGATAAGDLSQRLLDIVVSSLLLVATSPLMLVAATFIKLTSRGSALYLQQRIGLGGKPFEIIKLRTMRVGAEVETGPVWAVDADPRCTPVGVWLRRWCIDELPQLFNVMRGDMSLVGPRPERPTFVARFSREYPDYDRRHEVRPGLTGWAQVCGWRGNTGLEPRLEHDLYYVRNRSLAFDLYVLLLTPSALLFPRQRPAADKIQGPHRTRHESRSRS